MNSRDDLVIAGGTLTVTAKEDGLRGKDCVKIADGSLTVTAGGDGPGEPSAAAPSPSTVAPAPESAIFVADGAAYTLADGEDEPNAVPFSKDDLTI